MVEKATLGYLASATTAVLLGHENIPHAWLLLCAYSVLALFVLVCAAAQLRSRSPALRRLRTLCPLGCAPLLFSAAGPQSLALHRHLLDPVMLRWEQHLFGGHPNLMLDSLTSRPLNEALSLGYSSYYLYFVLPPAYFAVKGMDRALQHYVLAVCLAIYLCCLGFMLLPLAGPLSILGTAFSPAHLHGYVAQPFQAWLMDNADPPGTCFPSSHVGFPGEPQRVNAGTKRYIPGAPGFNSLIWTTPISLDSWLSFVARPRGMIRPAVRWARTGGPRRMSARLLPWSCTRRSGKGR